MFIPPRIKNTILTTLDDNRIYSKDVLKSIQSSQGFQNIKEYEEIVKSNPVKFEEIVNNFNDDKEFLDTLKFFSPKNRGPYNYGVGHPNSLQEYNDEHIKIFLIKLLPTEWFLYSINDNLKDFYQEGTDESGVVSMNSYYLRDEIIEEVDLLFLNNGLAYKWDNQKGFYLYDDQLVTDAIDSAINLLEDDQLLTVREHYYKALEYKLKEDIVASFDNARLAIENMLLILIKEHQIDEPEQWQAQTLFNRLKDKNILPQHSEYIVLSTSRFRNKTTGHPKRPDIIVTKEEIPAVIAATAASLNYLINKRP